MARLRSLSAGSYALGWLALELHGKTVLYHDGHTAGFMAKAVLDPGGTWAGFGLTNTAGQDDATGASWVANILDSQIASIGQARKKL